MRKQFAMVAVMAAALVTGLVVGGIVPAASQQAGRKVFTVCEKNNKGFSADIDADGDGEFSAGDYSTEVNPWFDPQTGKRHGRSAGTFTFLKPIGNRNGWFQFVVTGFFGEGKITAVASGKFSSFGTKDGASFPITGGTGHYRNASGVVTAKDGTCDGSRGTRITFDVNLNN